MSHPVSALPDVTTFAANIVVFFAAIAAVVAGTLSAIKKIKETWLDGVKGSDDKPKATIASAVLMETTTMLMWSESNRNVAEQLGDLKDEMKEFRFTMTRMTDAMLRDNR